MGDVGSAGAVVWIVTVFAVIASCAPGGSRTAEAASLTMDRAQETAWSPNQYVTDEIGRFTFGTQTAALAHVRPVTRTERCTRSGRTYLCGHYGWEAWRLVLEQQTLHCTPVGVDHVRCALPGRSIPDLGLWLIESGWSRADADAPAAYREAEQRAQAAAIGIFSKP